VVNWLWSGSLGVPSPFVTACPPLTLYGNETVINYGTITLAQPLFESHTIGIRSSLKIAFNTSSSLLKTMLANEVLVIDLGWVSFV
jgi:hypothetical protein